MDLYDLFDLMDADGRFAVIVTALVCAITITTVKAIQWAWYALEPAIFTVIEDLKDWWSGRDERKKRRSRDAAAARNLQHLASVARTASREDRRDVRARLRADAEGRRHPLAVVRLQFNEDARLDWPIPESARGTKRAPSSSAPHGGLDPRSAA